MNWKIVTLASVLVLGIIVLLMIVEKETANLAYWIVGILSTLLILILLYGVALCFLKPFIDLNCEQNKSDFKIKYEAAMMELSNKYKENVEIGELKMKIKELENKLEELKN